jgi:hypothetical protein
MIDFRGNSQYTDSFWAVMRAVTASCAKYLAKPARVNGELMKNSLALPTGLSATRIVAGCMGRKHRELA